MKKLLYYFLITALPLTISGCNEEKPITSNESVSIDNSTSEEETVFPKDMYYDDEKVVNTHFHSDVSKYSTNKEILTNVFNEKYFDADNNLNTSSVTYAELYVNNQLEENLEQTITRDDDSYYFFYNNENVRVVSRANGFAITLPTTTIIEPNLETSIYRTQYSTLDYTLTISKESGNPYSNWELYHDEWLVRYLIGDNSSLSDTLIKQYMAENKLSYTRNHFKTLNMLDTYEVEIISMLIEDNENVEKPYYNIGIIRKPANIKDFTLLVMKSKTDMSNQFDNIVKSYKSLSMPLKFGTTKRPNKFDLKVPKHLSEETQKYYKKLMEQQYTDWGIFIHSMYETGAYTNQIIQKTAAFESKEQMDYKFDIMPTYTHCGNYTNPTPFPLSVANRLAGGNGYNGKPVIQFTMQYTTSNNTSLSSYTPMFDIMRGYYDDYFRDLAKDMKSYGKPILFRLNNEMNSDWVSYCGQVTLLDPDIFAITWERMAKIFIEEGCDNVLYIFNPTGKTYPYCSWGEDLCYLPDLQYVQILGLTIYEYNNYLNGEDPETFFDLYQDLYLKNSPMWTDYPAIISEFGCGAGGDYPEGKKWRNAQSQAIWVSDMLDNLNNYRYEPFINQIKGAIWFNANDDYGAKVKNLLVLHEIYNATTIAAFKEGLAQTREIRESYNN